ncbi:hypothetical protein [Dethiosulfovibrio salsuginis]|uniref:HPt domain-containing protein n=1 Tax=Dethiosulfovibrio salsuginis TaxID=561720 RepID=A0A1X7IRJ2_9BACT|nr:hypothetical protein [Dethiosulfovibrio salsuginis]SMG17507.1 hypothetical protein SAMN06275492_10466 [Dethiosulfovibrio salsuginis]
MSYREKTIATARIIAGLALIILTATVFSLNEGEKNAFRERGLKDFSYRADHLATLMSYVLFERKQDGEDIANSRELVSYFQGIDLGMSSQYGLMAAKENIQELLKKKLQATTFQDNPVYSRIAIILDGGRPLAVVPSVIDSPPNWAKYRYTLDQKGRVTSEWEGGTPRLVISRPFFYKGRYQAQIVLWIVPSDMLARIRMTHNAMPWDQVFITTWNGQRVISPFGERETSTMFQMMEGTQGPNILKVGGKHLLVAKSDIPDTPLSLYLVAPEDKVLSKKGLDISSSYMGILSLSLFIALIGLVRTKTREEELLSDHRKRERLLSIGRQRLSLYRKKIALLRSGKAALTCDRCVGPSSAPLWEIIDREKFSNLLDMIGNQEDILEGIIRDFLDVLPGMVKSVEKSLREGDLRATEESCSTLKDALQSIGCSSLGEICTSIQAEVANGEPADLDNLEKDLLSGIDTLVRELTKGEWRRIRYGDRIDSRRRPDN